MIKVYCIKTFFNYIKRKKRKNLWMGRVTVNLATHLLLLRELTEIKFGNYHL